MELHSLNTALENMAGSLLKSMREATDSKQAAQDGLVKAKMTPGAAGKAQQPLRRAGGGFCGPQYGGELRECSPSLSLPLMPLTFYLAIFRQVA